MLEWCCYIWVWSSDVPGAVWRSGWLDILLVVVRGLLGGVHVMLRSKDARGLVHEVLARLVSLPAPFPEAVFNVNGPISE